METLSLKNPDDIENLSKKSTDEISDPISFTTPVTPLSPKEVESNDSQEQNSPPYPATSPAYNPSSPAYPATSPAYNPSSPAYPATSPAYNPSSPPYNPYEKVGDDSPQYFVRDTSLNDYVQIANEGEKSPEFAKESYTPHTPEGPPPPLESPAYTPRTPEGPPPPLAPKIQDPVEKKRKQSKKIMDIYSRTLVSKKISVEMKYIGNNIKEILEKRLKELHEGKCIAEGYVKKNSIKIITYSSGKICTTGILYEIAFECYVCFPVEGQLLNCIATNITKAGIKATSLETPSPFVVFISRDHQLSNKKFNTISEKDHFIARIIGQRFELNDPYISIIAEIDEKKRYIKNI